MRDMDHIGHRGNQLNDLAVAVGQGLGESPALVCVTPPQRRREPFKRGQARRCEAPLADNGLPPQGFDCGLLRFGSYTARAKWTCPEKVESTN
jgi:hypothetical protein